MTQTASKSFPCKEPGCGHVVSVEEQFEVPIQTGCMSSSTAYRCPACGRIHWNSGKPVESRGFEKVFYTGKGLERRSLHATEKAGVIALLIKAADGAAKSSVDHIAFQLSVIVRQGHSEDCGASSTSRCTCGLEEACRFISIHPSPY